jgi:hypothetical protein
MLGLGNYYDIIPAWQPLDLQTARDGDWVSLKNAHSVEVVVFKGAGTDGDDPTFSFQQATAVDGTGAKDLATITQYWQKEATTDLTGTGTWTKVTQSASASVAPGDPSAQSVALYVFHIEAAELDVDNGFDCIRVRCSDVGTNAQLGAAFYLLNDPRYPAAPESLPNSIAD